MQSKHLFEKSTRYTSKADDPKSISHSTNNIILSGMTLIWYLLFGALHESSHIVAASYFGLGNGIAAKDILCATLGRGIIIPELENTDSFTADVIRHSGWISSLLLALIVHLIYLKTNSWRLIRFAAWITAAEAITTDLFGFGIYALGPATLLCGNFGIILINPLYTANSKSSAQVLDLLTKMVNVTMIRGAQTGGVLTWAKNGRNEFHGIRSRVVNGKRTDLSKGVRARVKKDAFVNGKVRSGIQGFFGHTRFATSSKATFDGTHPHQWTPPALRRVYLGTAMTSSLSPKPTSLKVENFITHNGDFDFFHVNGKYYDLHSIQKWLVKATGVAMPTSVDSCAIAGMVDIIRTAGCFALSARFALLMGVSGSTIADDVDIPSLTDFEEVGMAFESALESFCAKHHVSTAAVGDREDLRQGLADDVARIIQPAWYYSHEAFTALMRTDAEIGVGGTIEFVRATVNAFFDNDLLYTTQYFLDNAKGSFGLFVSCSLDAHRSVCLAARGQTISIAFYPKKGLICYGSEQAAVKAGMNFQAPGGKEWTRKNPGALHDDETLRLDLDDLGGEVCLIDWGEQEGVPCVSAPNRHLQQHSVLRGSVTLVLHQESQSAAHGKLYSRMTLLEGNEFVLPLPEAASDSILADIQDIPRACKAIQEGWANPGLNRLTAWNLSRCLESRLLDRISGKIPSHAGTVDILLTGCEVSLWLAEQFASDLQKVFPRLYIKSISSNKLLGVFGQDMAVPSIGYPMSTNNPDLHDTVVIIVSHSGGTFAPLACSNLLQASTKNIFVVSSEWDTQIGKQLRSMSDDKLTASHIFSTDIGLRPAEACSISVAATQQLLTLIFEHICLNVLSKKDFRHLSGALITESDLGILERCNQDCLLALERIVGVDCQGKRLTGDHLETEQALRDAGKLWSDHVLENARAYVMSFIYIMVTVISGFPIVTGFALAFGIEVESIFYITRCIDALIYFFLPQINITILRCIQRRNLRHRMVGRTVVIGDIPWVAQAADAFLSKIFACSYSIAGINVVHGNPTDHLVHRHTHRVVRGSLLVAGRPDGRLAALTSAEATVCLSVNQASSIQSIGGTCESITIGHNPAVMSLTKRNIFLETHRPSFLCERLLDHVQRREAVSKGLIVEESGSSNTSPHFLLGAYTSWRKRAFGEQEEYVNSETKHKRLIETMIAKKKQRERRVRKFNSDVSSSDLTFGVNDFVKAYQFLNGRKDCDESGSSEHLAGMDENAADPAADADAPVNRRMTELQGLTKVAASQEEYFGQVLVEQSAPRNVDQFALSVTQTLSMELYEGRIASLERFVAMTVMFHELGSNVQKFFPAISLGYLGYSTDRSQSMVRIATTASPVSGADVRERITTMKQSQSILQSVRIITNAWFNYRSRQAKRLLKQNSLGLLIDISEGGSFLPSSINRKKKLQFELDLQLETMNESSFGNKKVE